MRQLIYRSAFIITILAILQSCERIIEVPIAGEASGAIIRVGTPSRSGQTATFTIDVHVVDGAGNYASGLGAQNFTMMEDTTGRKYSLSFRLLDIKGGNRTPVKGDYNGFLLLDQSGSTDDTDPDNLRIRSSQIFLESMGNNDKVALGSFTTGQLYPSLSGNVHLHGGFNAKGTTFYPALDSLKNTILKGNTPLFTSTAWAINYTAANAKAQNKVVILFTDGQNNGGSSQSAVESLSLQKKVPVYTVGLSTDVGFDVLNNMALNTGGSFMWAKDARQLISYFGTLGNLLRGNAEYYTLTFEASAGSLPTFSKLLYLQVSLPNGKKFWMPYVIKLA